MGQKGKKHMQNKQTKEQRKTGQKTRNAVIYSTETQMRFPPFQMTPVSI